MKKTANPVKRASKAAKRNVNREGQRWSAEALKGMTLRLPPALELKVRNYALAKGDLALIILFAVDHVPRTSVEIVQTRKAGLGLGRPMLIHVGDKARKLLRDWADAESTSVNAIVVSVLEKFFDLLERKPKLEGELQLELRARRGI